MPHVEILDNEDPDIDPAAFVESVVDDQENANDFWTSSNGHVRDDCEEDKEISTVDSEEGSLLVRIFRVYF